MKRWQRAMAVEDYPCETTAARSTKHRRLLATNLFRRGGSRLQQAPKHRTLGVAWRGTHCGVPQAVTHRAESADGRIEFVTSRLCASS